MKKEDALSYVYDFVRILSSKMDGEIKDIILFGSVARGDFGKESDVDIFVNVPGNKEKEMQKLADDAQNEFEIYSKRTWKLRGIDLPVKCIVGDIDSPKWAELKREIISSGIIIYGRYKELPKKLRRYFIFSFRLSKLKSKDQVAVVRKIYGYSSKKGNKIYRQSGILKELGGERLNPSVILVPDSGYKKLFDFLNKNKVSFNEREMWTG